MRTREEENARNLHKLFGSGNQVSTERKTELERGEEEEKDGRNEKKSVKARVGRILQAMGRAEGEWEDEDQDRINRNHNHRAAEFQLEL